MNLLAPSGQANGETDMTMRKKMTTALIAAFLAVVPGAIAALRAQAPGGPREGIVVHGHWTIDVREPDGRLVSHREFENALVASGASMLGDILARRRTEGAWTVFVNASRAGSASYPCLAEDGRPSGCVTIEQGWYADRPQPNIFPNLTVGGPGLVLSGTATANRGGSIDTVGASNYTCPSTMLPAACAQYVSYSVSVVNQTANETTTISGFSSAEIMPIAVAAGQLIQVTVTFTFS